jgi:lipopolysaccharide transport system permease protein
MAASETEARAWTLPAWGHLAELWRYRGLLWSWTERDIRIKYKQTLLGVAWAVLQPFLMMVVLTVLFSHFARLPSDGIPYPIFVYSALAPWTFFASSVTLASLSLATNMQLVTKVYFPREILPLASVAGCLLDLVIATGLLGGLMLWYQIPLTPRILLLPVLLAVQVLLTGAIAILVAGLCVFYRDVKYALPFALQLWMFATPVVYPLSMIPERYQGIFLWLNPMTGIVEGWRRVLLWQAPPDLRPLYATAVVSLVLLGLVYHVFKRWEERFADVI